jgi:hypothetical protein
MSSTIGRDVYVVLIGAGIFAGLLLTVGAARKNEASSQGQGGIKSTFSKNGVTVTLFGDGSAFYMSGIGATWINSRGDVIPVPPTPADTANSIINAAL